MDHLGPQWPKGFKRKTKWITWAPSGPRDSREKPSGSLGHPVAQGIQEESTVDHLGTQWPKGFMNQRTQVFVAATSGNQITSGTDTVAEVIVVP